MGSVIIKKSLGKYSKKYRRSRKSRGISLKPSIECISQYHDWEVKDKKYKLKRIIKRDIRNMLKLDESNLY